MWWGLIKIGAGQEKQKVCASGWVAAERGGLHGSCQMYV